MIFSIEFTVDLTYTTQEHHKRKLYDMKEGSKFQLKWVL